MPWYLVLLAAGCLFGFVLIVDGWTANRSDFSRSVDEPRERVRDAMTARPPYKPGLVK
jgi:hypothetical protein